MIRALFYPLFNAWLIRRTANDVRATVLSTTSVANALGQVGAARSRVRSEICTASPAALLSSAALLLPGALFFAQATLWASATRALEARSASTKGVSAALPRLADSGPWIAHSFSSYASAR